MSYPGGDPNQHQQYHQQPPPGYYAQQQPQPQPGVVMMPNQPMYAAAQHMYAVQQQPAYVMAGTPMTITVPIVSPAPSPPPVLSKDQPNPSQSYTPGPAAATMVFVQSPQPYPCTMMCPRCHRNVSTRVNYEPGLLTWMLCGGIFCLGGFLGCCLIPFFVDSAKDADHSCPNCGTALGRYQRIA